MGKVLRIGTRESQLALWQATHVRDLLTAAGVASEIVGITSEGDLDLKTPLYQLGVQGVFTRNLDAALLAGKIDLAVHSMKDVPTVMARGIAQAAVLARGPVKDLLVWRQSEAFLEDTASEAVVATGSVRRKAQWLHRYPRHRVEGLRGNVNTRLKKLRESDWAGAIFAAAGLERIGLRPENARELDWMLPSPAQGTIVVVCREGDAGALDAAGPLNDPVTALCTALERDFLSTLLGGCSTPISAYACVRDGNVCFRGNIASPDGARLADITREAPLEAARTLGADAARELLSGEASDILRLIKSSPAR